MSGNEQFEREFESFLEEEDSRIAALYRKLPRPEPDAQLDAAIAAMARRAAASRPRARGPRWIPALSAAAIIALAAGIAFRIGPTVWQQRSATPPPENAVSAGAAAKELGNEALKDETAQKPARQPAAPVARSVPAPAAPPAAANTSPQPALHKTETAAKRADAPAPQAFPLQAEQEKKIAQPAGAGVQAQGQVAEPAPERQRDERAQTAAAPTAAPAREEAVPPPAPVAAPVPTAEAPAAGGAADAMLAAPAPPAAKAAHLAAPRSTDPNARLYPEHWLQNIRAMLREGRHDEALRSLAEFRKMYPDYHLPDDLRDLK